MRQWPADKVERKAVSSLVPSARNARTHSDRQVAQIAASIGEWGWTVPILVDETGGVIAGHCRIMAALGRLFQSHGFLSHLHSSVVTMSQKSSLVQYGQSVS